MTRRCSHCSHNGHNSRTCPNRGVRLFGVRLTDGSIRKSASMGNLTQYAARSSDRHNVNGSGSPADGPDHEDGYASEDFVPGSSSSRERKKGVPWTEEEHRMFLLGLQKLGKGDWRGISRNYVVSRTPTQVASHAQKYFIRQSNVSRRKRRSSLFDIVADESAETNMASDDQLPSNHFMTENESNEALNVPPPLDKEDESMDSNPSNEGETVFVKPVTSEPSYPVIYPAYVAPFYPYPVQYWMGYSTEQSKVETHEVLKPTAVHSKAPINVDELVGMSKLSLGESAAAAAAAAAAGPSSLSLRLPDGSHRQSAFQPGPASGSSRMSSGSSPIHAV